MRNVLRFALLASVVVSAAGCRFKSYESFDKATSSREAETADVDFGDKAKTPEHADWGKYSSGGTAMASGGLNSETRYGIGAEKDGKVMPGFDQPAKGTGQQPGEYSNSATYGHAQTNAPAFQPSPGSVTR